MESQTTRSTCVGGCTALTSLQDGRRHAPACVRRPRVPAIVVNRPDVGGAGTSSNVRRVPVILPAGGVEASSYRIII